MGTRLHATHTMCVYVYIYMYMYNVKDERDLMCSKRSDKNIACRGEGRHLAKNIIKHSVTFHKLYFYYTSRYVIHKYTMMCGRIKGSAGALYVSHRSASVI